MGKKYTVGLLAIVTCLLLGTILSGCAPQPAAPAAPAPQPTAAQAAPTSAPAAPTAAPAAKAAPSELNIAAIFISPTEEPWNTSWLQTMDRLKASNPWNVKINVDYTENVLPPDAERVLRQYAESGKYPVIWAHSTFFDAVKAVHGDYPDIAWVVSGAGNQPLGGNVFWVDVYTHEPAYLLGMIAGKMTKSDTIGAVAAFPYGNVNLPVNGYAAGAKSVNPDVKSKITFIESWFDPAKAKESALAQIADGADYIFAERFGPFDAAKQKGVYAFGYFVDQASIAPDVVVASALALWDPATKFVLDSWYDHATKGTPYAAPNKAIVYMMKDGGSDLSGYGAFAEKLPKDVQDAVAKAKTDIMSGKLEVPFNDQPPAQ